MSRGIADYFVVGGTLPSSAPSYIRRPADDELFAQIKLGQFCFVLSSRQIGKSSLMIQLGARLRQEQILTTFIDLSAIGISVTDEQWYLGIISRLAADLRLNCDPVQWWHQHNLLGPVQRFTDFFQDIVLTQTTKRIAVFIDEIDSTLNLPFSDDFFSAIRFMYNLRANNPEYSRLIFVLLGVVSPNDLIKNRTRTPFNIGYAIDLQDFHRADLVPLEMAMEQIWPGQG